METVPRESIRITPRVKVSWGEGGVEGIVQGTSRGVSGRGQMTVRLRGGPAARLVSASGSGWLALRSADGC